ncbi:MAG: chorismate-binding protein [Phycisphaerales bacterium]|nr:chorismate-binding protein [Phycisphaerales bacterium]
MPSITRDEFIQTAQETRKSHAGVVVIPIGIRVLADQLTPVLAYRRLVAPDERTAPSFLLESVEGGDKQGRHSLLGARPMLELSATQTELADTDHRTGRRTTEPTTNPLGAIRKRTSDWKQILPESTRDRGLLPDCVLGGWFGYAGYDSVRFSEPTKLNPTNAPPDDRSLPVVSFGFYDETVIFDHVDKLVHLVKLAIIEPGDDAGVIYDAAIVALDRLAAEVQEHSKPLALGRVERSANTKNTPMPSNTTPEEHAAMVEKAREYIRAGDIFQVVVGQRFERRTDADPFDVYRALRAVNPSPYMVYLQTAGCILVASSPEILCRSRRQPDGSLRVTNRPLAGTRRRGRTIEEDLALEKELLADPKERAEHAMLVDLGRNDVGRVTNPGSINIDALMVIERYSHVMHISSTVTGTVRDELDSWNALAAALPVGTVSGAPKIRAMQIIDELEKVRRGPYGGGMGWVSLDAEMDIALALRTIVVPINRRDESNTHGVWEYHIQAAGGIVADSIAELEYKETVNKAAALARAIDLAEQAFKR